MHQDCVVALSKLAQQLWVPCDVLGCFNIKYPCPNIIEGGNCQCHGRYHGYGVLVVVLASSETSSFFLPLLYICAMKGIEDCLLPACCRLVLINDESLSLFWFLVFNRVYLMALTWCLPLVVQVQMCCSPLPSTPICRKNGHIILA